MKAISIFLSVSVLANVALVLAFVNTPAKSPLAIKPITPAPNVASNSSANENRPNGNSLPPAARSHDSRAVNLWSRFTSDDIDQLAARLKTSGFSYREIRAIIFAIAEKKFDSARSSLRGPPQDTPYWRPGNASLETPEQRAKAAELMKQESAFYRKYFGGPDALAEDDDSADAARGRYGDLPLEKLQRVARIQGDYDELQQKIFSEMQTRSRGGLTADDRKQLGLLQSELQRDIKESLTPEEFQEYQLRSSPTANRLRSALELLRPTESEYKALFALQVTVDEQFDMWNNDEQARLVHAEAIKNQATQIQAALGPERYADYQQLMESGSDKVTRLMSRLGLPLATAGKINAVRDDTTQRAAAVRSDQQLSAFEKETQLTALAQEAEAKLTASLGGVRGLEAYTDLKGDWLRALRAKTPGH